MKQKSVKIVLDYLTILSKLKKKEQGADEAWWNLVYQLDFPQQDLITIGKTIKKLTHPGRQEKEQNKNNENKETETPQPLSVYLFTSLTDLDLSEQGKLAAKILIESSLKAAQERLEKYEPKKTDEPAKLYIKSFSDRLHILFTGTI